MRYWQEIRTARSDLTDYVIHFTKFRFDIDGTKFPDRLGLAPAGVVLNEMLDDACIRPTFAPIRSKTTGTTSQTVRGPFPAVCFTEQPISSVLSTRNCSGRRYSGFGIAYHKYALFQQGGRPVIYGCESMLGKRIRPDEEGYEEGKEIYTGGLPVHLQYLFVRYKPTVETLNEYPVDFTWEREWRYPCRNNSTLPIVLEQQAYWYSHQLPIGALIVENDANVKQLRELLEKKVTSGEKWASHLTRIVSLETAARMLKLGDERYGRIETWPDCVEN